MKIYLPIEKRSEARALIETIESFPKIRPASHGSPGYEIPIARGRGRIHIMFSSDGVEVHRDIPISKHRHRTITGCLRTRSAYHQLKEILKPLQT